MLYNINNLFNVIKVVFALKTERGKKQMTNSELILRLVEMLLKEKEQTMKAKEQQDKAKDKCSNT